mmetsp:Transcript_58316/g.123748  ORF Transcript_58316/g.123748 Transcript_58316/m.123748 type:complete len:236 (+) Transcript_58316:341-1048(+)
MLMARRQQRGALGQQDQAVLNRSTKTRTRLRPSAAKPLVAVSATMKPCFSTTLGSSWTDDVLPRCLATPPTETFRVLFVGLGGGALPTYLLEHCKGRSVAVETVEYDPRVIKAATDFFGFKVDNTTNQVECSDGGAAVSRRAGKRIYDSVIVDAFGADDSVPESCSDQSFANATWSMLRPGGKLIQHVWFRQLLGVMNIYKNQFGANHVSDRTVSMFANYLITATYEGSSASTTA